MCVEVYFQTNQEALEIKNYSLILRLPLLTQNTTLEPVWCMLLIQKIPSIPKYFISDSRI